VPVEVLELDPAVEVDGPTLVELDDPPGPDEAAPVRRVEAPLLDVEPAAAAVLVDDDVTWVALDDCAPPLVVDELPVSGPRKHAAKDSKTEVRNTFTIEPLCAKYFVREETAP
jgi:hypothetical protein